MPSDICLRFSVVKEGPKVCFMTWRLGGWLDGGLVTLPGPPLPSCTPCMALDKPASSAGVASSLAGLPGGDEPLDEVER